MPEPSPEVVVFTGREWLEPADGDVGVGADAEIGAVDVAVPVRAASAVQDALVTVLSEVDR